MWPLAVLKQCSKRLKTKTQFLRLGKSKAKKLVGFEPGSILTCTEREFRLCWMKLCSSDDLSKKKSHSEKNPSFVHWDSSGTLTNQGKIKETSILEQLGRLG